MITRSGQGWDTIPNSDGVRVMSPFPHLTPVVTSPGQAGREEGSRGTQRQRVPREGTAAKQWSTGGSACS